MDFEQIKPEEIATYQGKCGIIVSSNGTLYFKELPDFGDTNLTLTTHNKKVTVVEENTTKKTKL